MLEFAAFAVLITATIFTPSCISSLARRKAALPEEGRTAMDDGHARRFWLSAMERSCSCLAFLFDERLMLLAAGERTYATVKVQDGAHMLDAMPPDAAHSVIERLVAVRREGRLAWSSTYGGTNASFVATAFRKADVVITAKLLQEAL